MPQLHFNLVLAGVQWSHCLVCLEDIIVVKKNFDVHLQNRSIILQRLRGANICLKPDKCFFCKTQLVYLGQIVSRQVVATDSKKTGRESNWPTPTTAVEVQKDFPGIGFMLPTICKKTMPLLQVHCTL